MTRDYRHLFGPHGLPPEDTPPTRHHPHGVTADIEHRITLLEVTSIYHTKEIEECKEMRSVMSWVGWALAIVTISMGLYLGTLAIRDELWISRTGMTGHDIN